MISETQVSSFSPQPSLCDPSAWFTFDAARGILGCGTRTARKLLKPVARELTRPLYSENGRPSTLYHYSAHPALTAEYRAKAAGTPDPVQRIILGPDQTEQVAPQESPRVIAAEDLAVGRLRAQAVREYHERKRVMQETKAAAETCLDWKNRPRLTTVETVERISEARGTQRRYAKHVQVGGFAISTLRLWAGTFVRAESNLPGSGIVALAPAQKGVIHKDKIHIPDELLNMVHAFAVSTARADIVKAVAEGRKHWPGEFPEVSIDTWRRRILERDPARAFDTLGKRGIAAFEREHVPDIQVNWSELRYNQRFEIDDAVEDFYIHCSDHNVLVRPYIYAISRTSTRQWVAVLTCEAPITQDQVRSLCGLTFASADGGIPEEMAFENGAVALDAYLRGLLEKDLGIKVHVAGMDQGKVHAHALADRGSGRFQQKAIHERMIGARHEILWQAPGQTGGEERHTGHANLDNIRREALARVKAGEPLILWTPEQWRLKSIEACKIHNSTPHSSMPEILVDPVTMEKRHMTPDEYAAHKVGDPVKVLDERLLPMFFRRGLIVPVTRNGITVSGMTYGRFDPDLQKRAGESVTIFTLREAPDLIYVEDLARCIEVDQKISVGDNGEVFERKRGISKARRSQYEQMVKASIETGGSAIRDATWVGMDPVRARRSRTTVAPANLLAKASTIKDAVGISKVVQAAENGRFELPSEAPSNPATTTRPRRGLLAREEDLTADLVTFGMGQPATL